MQDECWIHPYTGKNGYGIESVNGRLVSTHRAAYLILVGQIPVSLDLDHLCRNRACYNPRHLEPCTRAENLSRRPMPLTCSKGHARIEANARPCKLPRYDCAVCHRERERNRRAA